MVELVILTLLAMKELCYAAWISQSFGDSEGDFCFIYFLFILF